MEEEDQSHIPFGDVTMNNSKNENFQALSYGLEFLATFTSMNQLDLLLEAVKFSKSAFKITEYEDVIFRASKKGLYVYSKSAGGAAIGLVLIQREHFNNNNTTLQYNPKILEAIENEDSQDDPNLDFLQFSIALKDILSTVSWYKKNMRNTEMDITMEYPNVDQQLVLRIDEHTMDNGINQLACSSEFYYPSFIVMNQTNITKLPFESQDIIFLHIVINGKILKDCLKRFKRFQDSEDVSFKTTATDHERHIIMEEHIFNTHMPLKMTLRNIDKMNPIRFEQFEFIYLLSALRNVFPKLVDGPVRMQINESGSMRISYDIQELIQAQFVIMPQEILEQERICSMYTSMSNCRYKE